MRTAYTTFGFGAVASTSASASTDCRRDMFRIATTSECGKQFQSSAGVSRRQGGNSDILLRRRLQVPMPLPLALTLPLLPLLLEKFKVSGDNRDSHCDSVS